MSLNAGEISGSLKFDISDYTRAIAQAQSTSNLFPGIVSNSLDNPLLGFLGTIQKVKESLQGGLKLDASEYTRAILQAQSISSIFPGIVTNFLVNPLLGFIDTIKETGSALVGLAGIGAAALIAVQALGLMEGAFASLIVQLDIATASQLAFNAAANGLKGVGIGGAIGATFGTGIEGTVGGSIGGGIGGIVGGMFGGPLGAYAGSAIGGGIGTGIGSAFAEPVQHQFNINVTSPSGDSDDIAQTAANAASKDVFEKVKKHHELKAHKQQVNRALRGDR